MGASLQSASAANAGTCTDFVVPPPIVIPSPVELPPNVSGYFAATQTKIPLWLAKGKPGQRIAVSLGKSLKRFLGATRNDAIVKATPFAQIRACAHQCWDQLCVHNDTYDKATFIDSFVDQ